MSEFPALKIGKDDIASKSDRVAGDSVGVAHQTSEAKNLCSNPASPTMILMCCRIMVK